MKVSHAQEADWGRNSAELIRDPLLARQVGLVAFPRTTVGLEDYCAIAACLKHRAEIHASMRLLYLHHNPPDDECVIVCPNAEIGPGAARLREFMGLRLRPEHSATTWSVVWERFGA